MGHSVSWRCAWCQNIYHSVADSKFRMKNGHKRRQCKACQSKTVSEKGNK